MFVVGTGVPDGPQNTNFGRENKFSAEICILRTVGDAGPYNEYPYEKEPNREFFFYSTHLKFSDFAQEVQNDTFLSAI